MKYHIEFDVDFKRNTSQGIYIALEGIDGSGKTTQVQRLVSYFEKKGKEVIRVREPRKKEGLIGRLIQDILHGKTAVSPVAFQYLFSADRQMQHQDVILPALAQGKVVITDRCFWSAIPYGIVDMNEPLDRNNIEQKLIAQSILSFYHEFTIPDQTFYLNVALDTAIVRITKGDGAKEIYENKDKLTSAISIYQWLLEEFPKEFTIIDANKGVDGVTREIVKALKV